MLGAILSLLVFMQVFSPIQTWAPTGSSGTTDYAPISGGEYGWRTFGFRAHGSIGSSVYGFGDYVIDTSGDPGSMADWENWQRYEEDQNLLSAVARQVMAAGRTFTPTILSGRQEWASIPHQTTVEVTCDFYGFLTHKSGNTIDYYCVKKNSVWTMVSASNFNYQDYDLSNMMSVTTIARDGYKICYDAYCRQILGKEPNPEETGRWAHDQTTTSASCTVFVTIYATVIDLWATNDKTLTINSVADPYCSTTLITGTPTSSTQKWRKHIQVLYFWEGKNLPSLATLTSSSTYFPAKIGNYNKKTPIIVNSDWGNNYGPAASEEDSHLFRALAFYEPEASAIPVTIEYIAVDGSSKGKSVHSDNGGSVTAGQAYSTTVSSTVSGSDGKSYILVDDSEAGAYPTAFFYMKSISGTYKTLRSKAYSLPVSRYNTSVSTDDVMPTDVESGTKARLYVPVKVSEEKIVTVKYVTKKGVNIDPSPAQTYPIQQGEETFVYSYPPNGLLVDTSREPTYRQIKTNGSLGNVGHGTWVGEDVAFTPGHDTNYYLYIPVEGEEPEPQPDHYEDESPAYKDSSSGSMNTGSGTAKGKFYNNTYEGDYNTTLYIPSGLNVEGEVQAPEFFFSAQYKTEEGVKAYPVTFTWTYKIRESGGEGGAGGGEGGEGEGSVRYKTQTATFKTFAAREYHYTVLNGDYQYSQLSYAEMSNSALKDDKIVIAYNGGGGGGVFYSKGQGLKEPSVRSKTINLGDCGEQEAGYIPEGGLDSLRMIADGEIGSIECSSDYLSVNGHVVLDDSGFHGMSSSSMVTFNTEGLNSNSLGSSIDKVKANGDYTSGSTAGKVYYTGKNQKTLTFKPNDITVHTPVFVDVTITCDNNQYVQSTTTPAGDFILVNGSSTSLGSSGRENDSADVTIDLTNTGQHISKRGYGNNNYTVFVLRDGSDKIIGNQISFTCDIWIDIGRDNNTSNDVLIPANSWYSVDVGPSRYYIPMWVGDGSYKVTYRSIAYNGDANKPKQKTANTTKTNYIAYEEKTFSVLGKLYGFTFTDVDSTVDWSDVFRVGTTLKINYPNKYTDGTLSDPNYRSFNKKLMYYYTPGIKNELGLSTGRKARYSLPTIAGSSPKTVNEGVLKAGYTWNFKLLTTGSSFISTGTKVVLLPTFYWISADGTQREQVDLYYSERWDNKNHTFVKVGSSVDMTNIKYEYGNADALGIPAAELKDTAAIFGKTLLEWGGQRAAMYAYSGLISNKVFKTYSNQKYASDIWGCTNKTSAGQTIKQYLTDKGFTENSLKTLRQTYYFEYSLPVNFHAVSKTFDMASYVALHPTVTYKENFWKKDGYIVVHFDIDAYDASDKKLLSYGSGVSSMWNLEGYSTTRTDYYGKTFTFQPGDVFMIYTDKTKSDDYRAVQK